MNHSQQAINNWIGFVFGNCDADLINVCGTGQWAGELFPNTQAGRLRAAEYASALSERELPGVYMRMTTIGATKAASMTPGQRGGAELSAQLPVLWADVDYADPGHKHQANRPDLPGYDPKRRIKHPLPADQDAAIALIHSTGLPQPTVIINSGAGLYPIWKLTDAENLADPIAMDLATAVSEGIQRLLGLAAEVAGVDYGTGVGDLARVLRIPGTVHRKIPDNPRPCKSISPLGPTHDLYELSKVVEENVARIEGILAATPNRWEEPRRATRTVEHTLNVSPGDGGGDTPLDHFERETPWESILEPAGWTIHHTGGDGTVYWTRPGKERRDGLSATTNNAADRDRMYNFSSSTDLPVNEPMTKGFVWAQLNHAGDLKRAASALSTAGFGARTSQATTTATEAGEWTPNPTPQAPPAVPAPAAERVTVNGVSWLPPAPIPTEENSDQFPIDALPDAMRDIVSEISGALEVPADPVALMALSTVSALAAPRVVVSNDRYGWKETTSLYTMTAMPPGERKSAIATELLRPVWAVQFEMAEAHKELCLQREQEVALERGLSKSPAEANRTEKMIDEVKADANNPPRIMLPADTTVEALSQEMSVNGGHGALLDAEGAIAGILAGRYTKGDAANTSVELVLSGYDAEPYASSRIGRGRVSLRRPNLVLGILTQPSVMERLVSADGATSKGLLDRFLLARPVTRIGTRSLVDVEPVSPSAKRCWEIMIRGISESLPAPDEALGKDEVSALFLDRDAVAALDEYRLSLEPRMADGADLEHLRGWVSKAPGRVMRIAALLHLASGFWPDDPITGEMMGRAVTIGKWALRQARMVLSTGAAEETEATPVQLALIVRKLKASKTTSFSERELKRVMRVAWATRDRLRDAIAALEELGYLRSSPTVDAYGRAQDRYLVNPLY